MFTLHLVFALRLCTAEIATECWTAHGPLPSQDVILRYATRDECLAATHSWIHAYSADAPMPPRPAGVPATFSMLMPPTPNFECQADAPAVS